MIILRERIIELFRSLFWKELNDIIEHIKTSKN